MSLLVRSHQNNIHLRDAGDGVMKKITPRGTLFQIAPMPDPAIEIVQISAEEEKKYAALEAEDKRRASLKPQHDAVSAATERLRAAQQALVGADARVKEAEEDVEAAKQRLAAAEAALAPKGDAPKAPKGKS